MTPKFAEPGEEGILFSLDPDLSLHRVLKDLALPDGIGWTANDDTMYLSEILSRNVYAFDYAPSTGTMSNQRVFFDLKPEEGAPDGLIVDGEDHVWSTIYGGGKVVRISPKVEVVGSSGYLLVVLLALRLLGRNCLSLVAQTRTRSQTTFLESKELGGSAFRVNVGVVGKTANTWKDLDSAND